jgi:hypothetical protein
LAEALRKIQWVGGLAEPRIVILIAARFELGGAQLFLLGLLGAVAIEFDGRSWRDMSAARERGSLCAAFDRQA